MGQPEKPRRVAEKGARLKPGTQKLWGQTPFLRTWFSGIFTRQERVALAFLMGVSAAGLGLIGWGRRPPLPAQAHQELVVNVNRANTVELAALPGIGPKLAGRIAENRKQHGRFLTLNDLKRVKGITPKVLMRLRGVVCFD